MSSNFPRVPSSVQLPIPPQDVNGVPQWASSLTKAIQHLYRVLATRVEDMLNEGAGGMFSLQISRSISIGSEVGMIVPDHLEILDGYLVDIADGGVLEIT